MPICLQISKHSAGVKLLETFPTHYHRWYLCQLSCQNLSFTCDYGLPSSPQGNVKDYLNIAIRDGAIILAINLGSGSLEREIKPSGPRFDDNLWHQVVVRREAREVGVSSVNAR